MSLTKSVAQNNTLSYLMGSDKKLYEPVKMFKALGYMGALCTSAIMVGLAKGVCVFMLNIDIGTYDPNGEVLGNILLILFSIFIIVYYGKQISNYLMFDYLIEVKDKLYGYRKRSRALTTGYMIYDNVIDSKIELVENLIKEYDKLC